MDTMHSLSVARQQKYTTNQMQSKGQLTCEKKKTIITNLIRRTYKSDNKVQLHQAKLCLIAG